MRFDGERRRKSIREGGIVDLCESSATTLVEYGGVGPLLGLPGVGVVIGELLGVGHCEGTAIDRRAGKMRACASYQPESVYNWAL